MNNKVLLVGAGNMAFEYMRVLSALDSKFCVVGRGEESALKLKEKTGINVVQNGIKHFIDNNNISDYHYAVIAVNPENILEVAIDLIKSGVKHLLIEKPAGLNLREIETIKNEAEEAKVKALVAYNRRFYASTQKAKEIIDNDGGVSSFSFEFTEWPDRVLSVSRSKEILEEWVLANSSHVLDLAFYLGGKPLECKAYTAGSLHWHSRASKFTGAGMTENGALFSYQADWEAPGRWGVEIMTRKHRLILRPLEELWIQNINQIAVEKVQLDNQLDIKFKPGLFRQVQRFIQNDTTDMIDISAHLNMAKVYANIDGLI